MRSLALALACGGLLAATSIGDAWAGGKGGGGRSSAGASRSSGSHPSGTHHHHHAHGGTAVFISSPFFYPAPWYYPPPAYSYPAPPPVYIEQSTPQDAYWFYCPASGAYYPYVNECAGGWQMVVPQVPIQPSFPG